MVFSENLNQNKEIDIDIDIKSFTNELNFLKKETQTNSINHKEKLKDKINSKEEFKDFLLEKGLNEFDRSLPFGRYLRVLRYEDTIKKHAKTYGIPYENVFVLTMIESQGNPASINENDGGAGIVHFQPDVAREYGLKVFTDNEKYKKRSFKRLKKKGRTKEEIYTKHAKILKGILNDSEKGMPELEKIDERFNYDKCFEATCKYLKKIKNHYVEGSYESATSDKSRNEYKTNETNFKWMLALNGFNKGPSRFTVNFENGSHMTNIRNNKEYMENYEERLEKLLKQGLTGDEILEKLEFPFKKTKIKDPENLRTYYKYEGPSTNKDTISQVFDKRDKKHNNNKYKNTGELNVLKIKGGGIIIKAKSENMKTTESKEITKNKETPKDKGPFKYLNKSKDQKYNVYSYTIQSGGNYGGVLNQFQKNGGKIISTKVTNEKGEEYNKTKNFGKGTKVYIKEIIN
ncbi:MAG TPA: hypothetical protein VJ892_02890 [Candidatus Absconditabacterales bacterium]|nr:hypothetical protein [Candidatus Absconditabacterales bacterium]